MSVLFCVVLISLSKLDLRADAVEFIAPYRLGDDYKLTFIDRGDVLVKLSGVHLKQGLEFF